MIELINEISARMLGTSREEYERIHNELLRNLDEFKKKVGKIKIKTIKDYKEGMKLKSVLSSMFCYAFNNNLPYKEVWEIENSIGSKLHKFAKNYQKASKEMRPVIKYLLYRKWYPKENTLKILQDLLKNKHLWAKRIGDSDVKDYLVTGLHLAVGDNSFSIDRNGRPHRRYIKTCAIQAFYVTPRWERIIRKFEEEGVIEVPLLDEFIYTPHVVENCKGGVKISMSEKDLAYIWRNYCY